MFNLKGNHLYEFYGGHGTGKTQLCLHLAARFSQNRKVLYLDTNNDEVTDIFSYIGELKGNLKEIVSRQNCPLVMTNNATKNGTLPALGNFFKECHRFSMMKKNLAQNYFKTLLWAIPRSTTSSI